MSRGGGRSDGPCEHTRSRAHRWPERACGGDLQRGPLLAGYVDRGPALSSHPVAAHPGPERIEQCSACSWPAEHETVCRSQISVPKGIGNGVGERSRPQRSELSHFGPKMGQFSPLIVNLKVSGYFDSSFDRHRRQWRLAAGSGRLARGRPHGSVRARATASDRRGPGWV